MSMEDSVFIDGFVHQLPDIDPEETSEWLDSLQSVIDIRGKSRARYLLTRLLAQARQQGVGVPSMVSTPYINTIPRSRSPGSRATSTSSAASARSSGGTRS